MANEGVAAERAVKAPPPETESIVWREDKGRFQTPDGEAFLQYRLLDGRGAPAAAVMDLVHTYVPRSKRGQGLAARLCDAAFAHARARGMRVFPTCSYISVSITTRPPGPPYAPVCSTRIPLRIRLCFGGRYSQPYREGFLFVVIYRLQRRGRPAAPIYLTN